VSETDAAASLARSRYNGAWRWHFYAGLVVLPFLCILASTGLVMVFYTAVQTPAGPSMSVTAQGSAHSATELLETARAAVGEGRASQYIPPAGPTDTAQVVFDRPSGALVADVDPYRNRALRVVNRDQTPYAWAHRIHGTLLLGEVGDFLVETVAGLSLWMLVTGLYMWWLRREPGGASRRERWRRWHRSTGVTAALGLLFFLLSGLAWTNVWGGKVVQAWGTFPAEKWAPVALSGNSHGAMNHGSRRQVPWGLEQTAMPASGPGQHHAALPLAAVEARARALGFGPRYRINLPRDAEGVYTITANTMTGDIRNPLDERTVHLDQYSGELLGEVGFPDYSLPAKAMAAGVGLHQGSLGPLNSAFNGAACLVVLFLCYSGVRMWWLRRPSQVVLAPPPRPLPTPGSNALALITLACGVVFPLLGLALLFGLLVDRLYLRSQRRGAPGS
jgi:uncharacterized iron-regulated membrane protein